MIFIFLTGFVIGATISAAIAFKKIETLKFHLKKFVLTDADDLPPSQDMINAQKEL